MARLKSLAIALTLSALPTSLWAEDYPFIIEALPPHLAERAAAQASQLLLGNIIAPDDYFISGLKVWNTTQPIRVCFFGGPQLTRARIAKVASQWTTVGGYVPLDFGNTENPRTCGTGTFDQIRVGFAYKGYWSMVGTDSVNLTAQYEQSMNLALYDINPPPEPTFSRVVLHEFGHALGFQHEHQSPNAPCVDEFDWDAIYAYLQGAPNYWSIEQINHNLRPRPPRPGDGASPGIDRASIMLYSFPPSFYKAGTAAECYTLGNNAISELDVEGIVRFYPATFADQIEIQKESLQSFFDTVDTLADVSEEAKSIAKLTASSLSLGVNAAVVQSHYPWVQPGAGNLAERPGQMNQWFDAPVQYLSPQPRL